MVNQLHLDSDIPLDHGRRWAEAPWLEPGSPVKLSPQQQEYVPLGPIVSFQFAMSWVSCSSAGGVWVQACAEWHNPRRALQVEFPPGAWNHSNNIVLSTQKRWMNQQTNKCIHFLCPWLQFKSAAFSEQPGSVWRIRQIKRKGESQGAACCLSANILADSTLE